MLWTSALSALWLATLAQGAIEEDNIKSIGVRRLTAVVSSWTAMLTVFYS